MRVFRLGIWLCLALPALGTPPVFSLPPDVVPKKHSIELTVDANAGTFAGLVEIDLELRSATTEIWLNSKGLTISEVTLRAGESTQPARVLSSSGEFLGVELDTPVGPGSAVLTIRYQGKLDEKLTVGLYRRKIGGDWYAFTTFTPIEARRAFPCFDEPRFKTPWDVALRIRKEASAYSNARELPPVEETNGWKLVRFERTLPIPAELVAFAVGPFEVLEGGIAGKSTPVRVITPKGRSAEGMAALQATAMVLPRLEAYTGIPYPFGKLDHVAIPDIEFSAVENPGLITYRSRSLLLAPETDTAKAKPLRYLEAHEIGHQWFGNLVTQADWREVWLSEGFATWIADKVMDMEQPRERVHMSAIAARERIMQADTSARTRAVRTAVDSREGSAEIYNRFVYEKAGSILMMVEAWLGEDAFRTALRSYLDRHRYSTATMEDLAAVLRETSHKDPAAVLRAFLDQGGAPGVQGDVECEHGDVVPPATLQLTQTGSSAIPVCWRTDSGVSGCEVLDTPERRVKLPACPAWVYMNAGGTGYYRTTWSGSALALLRITELSPAERLTLAYDLRAQKTDRPAARNILERLSKDTEPEIAQVAREALK